MTRLWPTRPVRGASAPVNFKSPALDPLQAAAFATLRRQQAAIPGIEQPVLRPPNGRAAPAKLRDEPPGLSWWRHPATLTRQQPPDGKGAILGDPFVLQQKAVLAPGDWVDVTNTPA